MEHNHFEHCLQGWPTLLVLLAVASLGSAGFIALLGGVGWLLAIRQQSVTPVAPSVVATTAEVTTSPVPAIRWGRSLRHVRGERPGEDAWTGTRWVHLTGHAARARRRALFRGPREAPAPCCDWAPAPKQSAHRRREPRAARVPS